MSANHILLRCGQGVDRNKAKAVRDRTWAIGLGDGVDKICRNHARRARHILHHHVGMVGNIFPHISAVYARVTIVGVASGQADDDSDRLAPEK